jgi:hypothetical protein
MRREAEVVVRAEGEKSRTVEQGALAGSPRELRASATTMVGLEVRELGLEDV